MQATCNNLKTIKRVFKVPNIKKKYIVYPEHEHMVGSLCQGREFDFPWPPCRTNSFQSHLFL